MNTNISKLQYWKSKLDGTSPLLGNHPAAIKKMVKEGKIKATLIADLNCPHAGILGHSESYNRYAHLKNNEEIIHFRGEDNSEDKKIIGFSDKQNRYVGHCYIGENEYNEIVEFVDASHIYVPQDAYHRRLGIISKTYKLPKDLVDKFANKCKENGESQSGVLKSMMEDYINDDG